MRNGPQLSIGLASRNMVKVDTSSGRPLHVPVHGSTNTREFPGPGQYACEEGVSTSNLGTKCRPIHALLYISSLQSREFGFLLCSLASNTCQPMPINQNSQLERPNDL